MKTIYKYPLEIKNDTCNLLVPGYRRPLHVGLDPTGTPAIWMEVDTTSVPVPMTIFIVGTGFDFDPKGKLYLGSFVDGSFVWHIYYS